MAQSAQNMALKAQLPFAIGLAICNGEPLAVARLAHPKTAYLLFGVDGIDNSDRSGAALVAARDNDVARIRTRMCGMPDVGGAPDFSANLGAVYNVAGLGHVDAFTDAAALTDAKLAKLFKPGPGIPLNGAAGPAMRAIIAEYGDGPQGAIRLGLKLQMEQARLGHDRTFGGLVPMLFGANQKGSMRSIVDPYNYGSVTAEARAAHRQYSL
jgi:hypothetical protein